MYLKWLNTVLQIASQYLGSMIVPMIYIMTCISHSPHNLNPHEPVQVYLKCNVFSFVAGV